MNMSNYYISKYTGEEIEAMLDAVAHKTLDTNCPNCGAPIVGPSCEYCGTIFDLDYLTQISKRRSKSETYNKIIKELESYSVHLELTADDTDYLHALMQIANITASETRRLRGI